MHSSLFRSSLVLAAMALVGLSHLPAHAQTIIGVVTATTNMGTSLGSNLANTVNYTTVVGTSKTLTGLHALSSPSNSWTSGTGVKTGHVLFNLNGAHTVDTFSLWNNSDGPGSGGTAGIKGVTVEYSLNGTTFFALAGGPTQFSEVTGHNIAGNPPQIFNFAPVQADYFRFDILSNYGYAETNLSEAAFGEVPEPGSAAMLAGLAVPCLGVMLRRGRAAPGRR